LDNVITAMTYEQIVSGLRSSYRELENEGRLMKAGLKTEQQTAEIVERYAWLYSDAALTVATKAEREAAEGVAREAARRVRAAIMQGIINRRTATLEDRMATHYASSRVTLAGGEEIPFFTAQSMLSREPDASRREQLGVSVAKVMIEADGMALELMRATMDVIESFGYDSYLSFWSDIKEVDYSKLRTELERVASACSECYKTWITPRMEAIGSRYGECSRWHFPYFRGLPEHDVAFSQDAFEPAMRRTFAALDLDLFSLPSVHIDLENRPAKDPRASVWVPEAGVEVHLLTRPLGGSLDYGAFMHEAGHALHFGLTDPAIGWPLANLPRSMAYAELWSYLIERIGFEPAWLSEALGLDEDQAQRIAADMAGVDLMMFMRYCGKLANELELFSGDPLDRARGHELYARTMSERTGFRYGPDPWQFDRDPGLYSADYLRAWLAQSALRQRLVEMFGARWWASEESGRWLRNQWRKGSMPEAEETVAQVGGKPWSGDALIAAVHERL
jgi:hypothetical protein